MNERIRELGANAGYPDYMTYGQDKVLERFAELIVRECADVVKYYHSRNESVTPGQILQHFGIE